jgi:hypothetical protein
LQRSFGAVERHEGISVWRDDGDVNPLHLVDCGSDPIFDTPQRVQMIFDSHEASASCTSDKWIGAAACVVRRRGPSLTLRFPFLAADRRNDWTAIFSVRF